MSISLRPLEFEDIAFTNTVRNLCVEYLHDQTQYSLSEALAWFEGNNDLFFIISLGDVPVGYFRTSNHSKTNGNIYLGADIHPDYQGRGIAQTAYPLAMRKLFDELFLHKISLEVLSTNSRAIHLYEKLGFVREGCKREEVKLPDGTYVDSVVMSLLKEDFHQNETV